MSVLKKMALVGLVAYAMCEGYDPRRAEQMLKEQTMSPRQYLGASVDGEAIYNAKDIIFADVDADKDGKTERYRIFVNAHGAVAYRSPKPMFEHVTKDACEYGELEKQLHEKYPEKKLY